MPRHPVGPAAVAARLTWGALAGPSLGDIERVRLAAGLGGVVLFERNIESPAQLRALTAAIRAVAGGPVRIAVDQEVGHVVRVGPPLTAFPSPMAVAAAGSRRLAREVAAASARELRALGIDTVLAPVLDVAAVPANPAVGPRSFGDDPHAVARLGAAAVRGYLEGGVIPVPKHLPGHGRTAEDSHVALARVRGSREDLDGSDLPPFAAAVAAGAPALMAGHVTHDALDAARPASLSGALARLARGQLAFDGVLVTDALVMDAITELVPLEEAGALAIEAGMDAVMAIEGQRRVLAGLTRAIEAGHLAEARIREALGRIAALELEASTLRGRPLGAPLPDAACDRHAGLARDAAARSVTLVRDPASLLPIAPRAGVLVVDVAGRGRSPIDGQAGSTIGAGAGRRIAHVFARSRVLELGADEVAAFARATSLAADAEVVVLLTRDAFAGPAAELARTLAAGGPLVHVALRNPLDLALTRAAGTGSRHEPALVAAYADTPATLDAVADALAGRVPFRGRLPVRLDAVPPPDAAARPTPVDARHPVRVPLDVPA